jgi:hypothetical protein
MVECSAGCDCGCWSERVEREDGRWVGKGVGSWFLMTGMSASVEDHR